MWYVCVRVKLVKQVWTCRKYLYANVGLGCGDKSALEQQAIRSGSIPNSNDQMHSSQICINIHWLNSVNRRSSAKRLSGLQAQCPIRVQMITFTLEVFCLWSESVIHNEPRVGQASVNLLKLQGAKKGVQWF